MKRKPTVAIVLGVMLAGVACSSGEPESLGGTEQVNVNLIVDGTDVRSVRFTVEGGDLSSPLEGRFNVHDDQDPPIWATIMDLSPGDYVITLVALDEAGEVLCTGSQGFSVLEGQITQVDVALLCTVGDGSEPLGNADIEGRFEIVEANLCPRLNYVGVIPDVIEEGGSADVEVLAQDSDGQTVQVTLSATAGTLSPASFDIVPPAIGGLSIYECTASGAHTVTALVSDGDPLCNKTKSIEVGCGCLTDPAGLGAPHENMQPSLALRYLIATFSRGDIQAGEVTLFAGTFAPGGWAEADGRLLPIAQNAELFSALGTTYGGDGVSTFALPDLRGRTAIFEGQGTGLTERTLGWTGGVEQVSLGVGQMAAHSHVLTGFAQSTESAGNDQTHENMQPSTTLLSGLVQVGVFPTQGGSGVTPGRFLARMYLTAAQQLPLGILPADGSLSLILQNTALFSLLGTTFGGDGVTTFAVPAASGRALLSMGTAPGLTNRPLGWLGGAEGHALSVVQLPSHAHAIGVSGSTETAGNNQSHANMQPSLAMNYIIRLTGSLPTTNGQFDDFIGEVALFAGNFAPGGFAAAAGQLLSIAQNPPLFSILGTTYGGDGRTTFALPDLRGRVPIGAGEGPDLSDRPLGWYGGQEDVVVNESELPAHMHAIGEPASVFLCTIQ